MRALISGHFKSIIQFVSVNKFNQIQPSYDFIIIYAGNLLRRGSYFGLLRSRTLLAKVLFPHVNRISSVFPTVLDSHIYYSSLRRDDSSESSNDGSETADLTMDAPEKKTTNSKTTSIAIQTCSQSAISTGAINQVVDEKMTESESVKKPVAINGPSDGNQLEAPGHKNHKSADENKSDVNRKKQLQKITEEL